MGARRVRRRRRVLIGGGVVVVVGNELAEEGFVEGGDELGLGSERTTSSASRETGSPMVASFASFDRESLTGGDWELWRSEEAVG